MKNVYQDLIVEASLIIDRTRSTASVANKFIKIKLKTEDNKIHELIDSLIEHINEAKRLYNKKLYTASSQEYGVVHDIQKQIIEYCNTIISSGKPE